MVPFPVRPPAGMDGLEDAPAQALLFELAGLPDAYRVMQRENMGTALARQLLAIAKAFSGFYTNCPILWAENTRTGAHAPAGPVRGHGAGAAPGACASWAIQAPEAM